MRILYFSFAICLLITSGCKKDKTPSTEGNSDLIINNDASQNSSRVSTADAGVIFIDASLGAQRKTTVDSSSNEYPMALVASVSAPIHQGDTLRATHVEIYGNYAYVSYNIEGAKYKGAIDIFNINTISTPTLVSSVIFPTNDISAIAYYNDRLYVAGARENNQTSSVTTPAMIGYIQLSGGAPTSTFQYVHYTGYAATGIIASNNKIFLTTGTTGGLYIVDPSNLQQIQNVAITDARGVAANNTYIAVQTGSSGVNLYNSTNYSYVKNISLATDIAEAKRTMDFNGDYLVIATGLGGVKYYNVNTGVKADEIILPTSLPGVINSNDIVTNAVSFNNNLIFAANGAAGTYVVKENTNNHNLYVVGSFGFGIGNSINYVKSKDNYLFVAAGRGGMKIIKMTPPTIISSCTGLPAYTGSTNMNISANKNVQYGGSLSVSSLDINSNSSLLFCGNLALVNNSEVKSNSLFQIQGSLAFGSSSKTLTINSGATLRIEGNVTIYGNLDLKSNSKLEFVGNNNSITINGNVNKGSNVSITGTYNDVNKKL